jgi:hypothetical protein
MSKSEVVRHSPPGRDVGTEAEEFLSLEAFT